MVKQLEADLPQFGGNRSRSRCFAHIINLVVKSILQLFEKSFKDCRGFEFDGNNDSKDDNVEGWRNESASLSEWQIEELNTNIQPVKSMLAKVVIYKPLNMLNTYSQVTSTCFL